MPQIEILPSSSSSTQPGYAFVPDTRYVSAQVPASQPVTGRKRAARSSNIGGGDTSIRQQNAVLKHLQDLDRDNHRDVQIPIPKDSSGRVSKSKMTPNVRRVLTSQKTFANHLADEEAALAQKPSNVAPTPNAGIPNKSKSKSTSKSRPSGGEAKDPLESNPLLRTYVPSEPSPEVMQALISAPPLSYNAARAVLPSAGRPPRHFCEICGYWGSIKCMKCGVRVCSWECQGTHDEGRCLKFYG